MSANSDWVFADPDLAGPSRPGFLFLGGASTFDQSRNRVKLEVKDFQFAESSA
ncbi:MAG: hypothetical protein ABSC42_00280 [Tepidisphaeraceae bacterium]